MEKSHRGLIITISIIICYFVGAFVRWLSFKRENKFTFYLYNIRANLFVGILIVFSIIIIFFAFINDEHKMDAFLNYDF